MKVLLYAPLASRVDRISDQLHAPSVLTLGEDTPLLNGASTGLNALEENRHSPLPETEPSLSDFPDRSPKRMLSYLGVQLGCLFEYGPSLCAEYKVLN